MMLIDGAGRWWAALPGMVTSVPDNNVDRANCTLCCGAILDLYGKKNMILSCHCWYHLGLCNSYADKIFPEGQLTLQQNVYKMGFASPCTRYFSSDFGRERLRFCWFLLF